MPAAERIPISQEAARFVEPGAPREAKLLAARGTLPLSPAELVTVLFLLAREADAEIREIALTSVGSLPPDLVHRALDQGLAGPLIDFLARRRAEDPVLLERIALEAATPDVTIAFLASLPHKGIVEIVSDNQARILRSPAIVEALGSNPLTGRAAIDRILSFLGLEGKLKRVHAAPEVPGGARAHSQDAGTENAPLKEAHAEAGAAAQASAASVAVAGGAADDDTSDLPEDLVKTVEDTPNQANVDRHSLMQVIQALTVFQRIRLARMGNKEARGLLARDRNKIVATAAIRSPKITENEVVAFARSRSVNDEIPRIIARDREWTKAYQVQLALTANPKTPLIHSLKFLNYLQEADLRAIAKSRDVPRQVTTAARRILMRKKGDH